MPKRDGTGKDPEVIEAITFVRLCQEFRTLPRTGGILDQDSYHVWLIEHVLQAQNEKQQLEEHKNKAKQIHK
jgi:hypothetical protein